MAILSEAEILAYIESQPDEHYDIVAVPVISYEPPITDKHIVLACQYFNENLRPGKRFDFRKLAQMTRCRDDGGPRDFTADGIEVGQHLTVKQVKKIFAWWLAEYHKRQAGS